MEILTWSQWILEPDVKIRAEKYLEAVATRGEEVTRMPVRVRISEVDDWWEGTSDAETLEQWSLGRGPLWFKSRLGWGYSEYLMYPVMVDFGDLIFDIGAANRGEHPWK